MMDMDAAIISYGKAMTIGALNIFPFPNPFFKTIGKVGNKFGHNQLKSKFQAVMRWVLANTNMCISMQPVTHS